MSATSVLLTVGTMSCAWESHFFLHCSFLWLARWRQQVASRFAAVRRLEPAMLYHGPFGDLEGRMDRLKVMLMMLHHGADRIPALSISCLGAYALTHPKLAGRVDIALYNPSLDDDELALLARVEAERPAVLGLSCYAWNLDRSLALAGQVKTLRPEVVVVLGGPQVSFDAPALLERHRAVDYVVCGEGEVAFAGLLEQLLADHESERRAAPEGVAYRRGADVVSGGAAPALEDLDALPCCYTRQAMPDPLGRVVYFETGRGCPYHCAFCSWGSGEESSRRRVRQRSLGRIEGDLRQLRRRGVNKIYFCDASLCLGRSRAKAILRLINGDDAFTGVALDVDAAHLDAELVELMRPKLLELLVGVQSIHAETLELCRRRWDRAVFEAIMRPLLSQTEIPVAFQVIYGLPGDNHRRFMQTLDYLAALGPAKIQPFQLQVLPGTHFRAEARALGLRYDPRPPHHILEAPGYSHAEILRSRKVASLVHKLGCGFSWRCVPDLLEGLGLSLSTFLEGLVEVAEREDLLSELELHSEVHLLKPSRELDLLLVYLERARRTGAVGAVGHARLHTLLRARFMRHQATGLVHGVGALIGA